MLSLLNGIDKIWETCVKIQLSGYLLFVKFLTKSQYGFIFAKNTADALLNFIRFAGGELGTKNQVLLTVVDIFQ